MKVAFEIDCYIVFSLCVHCKAHFQIVMSEEIHPPICSEAKFFVMADEFLSRLFRYQGHCLKSFSSCNVNAVINKPFPKVQSPEFSSDCE